MASTQNDIFNVIGQRVTIGVGATLAVYFGATTYAGFIQLKMLSGGTLEIFQASTIGSGSTNSIVTPGGSTLGVTALGTLGGTGYLMNVAEVIQLNGPAHFYLSATGATCAATILTGLTPGS